MIAMKRRGWWLYPVCILALGFAANHVRTHGLHATFSSVVNPLVSLGLGTNIMFGSLGVAIFIVLGIEAVSTRLGPRAVATMMWLFMAACFVACVGMATAVIAYCLPMNEWIVLAIALPIGAVLFVFFVLTAG
ncbi:MAG: hypothetical protein NTW19_18790 [Planctomycetota bacterium]|nr:hypothetical protein [Planctomycetota bacterium]